MTSWTEERISKLKALAARELTAAEIAAAMGDVSRSAVTGKANRMGIALRPDRPSYTPKPSLPKLTFAGAD